MKDHKNLYIFLLVTILIVVIVVFSFMLIKSSSKDSTPQENFQSNSDIPQNYPPVEVLIGVRDINNNYGFSPNTWIAKDVSVKKNNDNNYDGVSFSLYSNNQEDINCKVKEYYGYNFNSEFDLYLKAGSGTPNVKLVFEAGTKPKEVKYDINCKGVQSNLGSQKSLILSINYLD